MKYILNAAMVLGFVLFVSGLVLVSIVKPSVSLGWAIAVLGATLFLVMAKAKKREPPVKHLFTVPPK